MRFLAVLLLLPLLSCVLVTTSRVQRATTTGDRGTLFVGGVVAAGPAQTPARGLAVWVTEGVVREIGPAAELRRAHPSAEVIDTSNGTILPGLVDAHAHLYGLGLSLRNVDLVGAQSYEEVLRRMKERAATLPAGEWVIGRGWDQNEWPVTEFPTVAALDAALPDHPAFLRRIDGHAALANSAAMKIAGVSSATTDPSGGKIIRDAAGNPTGVFIDNAMGLVERIVPQPGAEERKTLIRLAGEKIASEGLTGIHDAGIGGPTLATLRELIAEKRFPVRVYAMLADSPELFDSWFASGTLKDEGGLLTVRSVKLYGDGALGSRGAALLEPYSDEPSNHGLVITSAERIAEVGRRARAAGFQVNVHAIGDRAVRHAIDGFVAAGMTAADRARIEHLQVISPEDLPRLSRHGIISSVQPTHATSDMDWAERRLGPERIRGAYAWRSVLNSGGRLALGSDFPVEKVNPFHGLHSAVTRTDLQGRPPGGWYPAERLTLAEALRGFTLDAAYAAFEESSHGTIEPGKAADFTIVEGDFFAVPPLQLHAVKVRYTVVNGKVVFAAK